jgi:hypothetical protein
VAYRNFTILPQNLKHHPGSELGALEVEFWPLPMGKPDWGVWLDAKFDSTQFQKRYLNPSSYAKVMTVLPKHVRVTVLEGGISLGIEIGKAKTCCI